MKMTESNGRKYGTLLSVSDDSPCDPTNATESEDSLLESQRLIGDTETLNLAAPTPAVSTAASLDRPNRSLPVKTPSKLGVCLLVCGALASTNLLIYVFGNNKSDSRTGFFANSKDGFASISETTLSSKTATIFSIDTAAEISVNSNDTRIDQSLFFEHVLQWKIMDVPKTFEERETGTKAKSNHYHATLEFCSDPKKGLYAYGPVGNCVPGKPAPLIKMKPKTFYHLTLVNNAHIDTNIHTHGLHVSGVGTVDDVTRVAEPGMCLEYEYYILDDADVGTFWYHPHRHPLVTKSAFGGAYGMIIVEESVALEKDFYPAHLSHFLTQNEVLLQFSSMYNKKLENAVRTNKVNGLDRLKLVLGKDTFYYFRISTVVFAEAINYVEFDPPTACEVRAVAYDGVYRSEIPSPASNHKHMMSVSSRGDFAVSCTADADIHFHQGKIMGELSKMVQIQLVQSQKLQTKSNFTHATIRPALPSSPYWDSELKTSWKPRRPYYMPDLSKEDFVDEYWSVSMDDYFVNGTKGVSVNQQVWDPKVALRTFDLGQLVEYSIMLSQTHPYHAHINRMQIVQPGGCGLRFEEGEYFDTIVQSEETEKCLIRTKFFDFAGRVVIHCHRFGHEDKGMMTWIDVLGGHGHGMKAAPQSLCSDVML